MANLAKKTRIPNLKRLMALLVIYAILCYSFPVSNLLILEVLGLKYSISICMGDANIDSISLVSTMLVISFYTISISIGLYFDLSMYFLVKEEKEKYFKNAAKLIPWKSGNAEESEDDLTIPVRVTLMTTGGLIVSIFSLPFSFYLIKEGGPSMLFATLGVCSFLIPSILLFVVLFTVKVHKKTGSVKPTQPPTGLQFHEESISYYSYISRSVMSVSHVSRFYESGSEESGSEESGSNMDFKRRASFHELNVRSLDTVHPFGVCI